MSYEQLTDAAQLLFRRMALVPGADFGASLAAVIAEVPVPVAEDHLDDLVDLGLLEAAAGGRYRFHDLVRLYAQQRLEQQDPADAVRPPAGRMVAWLLETLTDAGQWFEPNPPDPDASAYATPDEAEEWIRTEAEHWFPALGDAAVAGDHDAVVSAVIALHWFSFRWAYWHRWPEAFTLGFDSSVALGDLGGQAHFLNDLAFTYTLTGRDHQHALTYAERARSVAQQAGDVLEEGSAWQHTARAHFLLDDPRAAMDAIGAAAELYERVGDADSVCQALTGRGSILVSLGEPAAALPIFQRVLDMVEDPGSGMTPSIAAGSLPMVLIQIARALGRTDRGAEGEPLALRAADLFEGLHMFAEQAYSLCVLAEECYGDDQSGEAKEYLLRAAQIYESAGRQDEASRCRHQAAEKGATAGA